MSRLGQVSLTKPTYRRIVLRCCSVPTSEALARLRVSDLTAAAPCGPSLFEHTGFCKQGGPVLESGATGIGKLENGSRPEAISESRAAQKVFARAGSRKPRSDQHQECS